MGQPKSVYSPILRHPPQVWAEVLRAAVLIVALAALLALALRSYRRIDYLQIRWKSGDRPYDIQLDNGSTARIDAIELTELRAYFRCGRLWLGFYRSGKHSPEDASPAIEYTTWPARYYEGYDRLRPPDWTKPRAVVLGLATARKEGRGSGEGVIYRALGIPLWVPALVIIVVPVRGFLRRQQFRRRLRQGLCLACGYDLRCSSERCPECGAPIAPRAASAGRQVPGTSH